MGMWIHIMRVAQREVRRTMSHPRYLLLLAASVVFTSVFFATMTRDGQPQRLPIGIVDLDNSYLSRRICHELNATPGVCVEAVYTNHAEARRAMQRGVIFAFYEIPHGTYNEVLQFHGPHFSMYVNSAYILAGTLSYKQLATMGMLATGAVQREVLRKKGYDEEHIMGIIQPVTYDTHNINNPWINYGVYLMTTLLPAIIAFLALLHMAYVVAIERGDRTLRRWIRKAGGNVYSAMLGKMLPYTLWYTLLVVAANFVMFTFLHFPLQGSWGYIVLASFLLIFAAQSAALLIAACLPDAPLTMGVTTIYGAMSFSLSGFSFPVESMPLFFQAFSWLYPIRHYFLIYTKVGIYGQGFDTIWPQVAALVAFGLLAIVGSVVLQRQYKNNRWYTEEVSAI